MQRFYKYLDAFEHPVKYDYVVLESEMWDTMEELGFVDLWESRLDQYLLYRIRLDDPSSYQPVVDKADSALLKALLSYVHKQITSRTYMVLYEYNGFFVYALKRLLALNKKENGIRSKKKKNYFDATAAAGMH